MKYGIIGPRGWIMSGAWAKEYRSVEEALPDLKKGCQLEPIPEAYKSQYNALPDGRRSKK
jgi:hypothetical protein